LSKTQQVKQYKKQVDQYKQEVGAHQQATEIKIKHVQTCAVARTYSVYVTCHMFCLFSRVKEASTYEV